MKCTSKIVGILNVTPDSFSDGGSYFDDNAILHAAQKLIADGADVIDIGAESTRPDAVPLSPEEEWGRLQGVLPEICAIARKTNVQTSIDTRHADTARRAIECGIDWVNDVSGAGDPKMLEVLKNWQGRVVIMHNLGIPANKNITLLAEEDAVLEVKNWLEARIMMLEKNGIAKERIIIDPGIGFGKTAAQSWQLINNIEELRISGAKMLVGHSRKSFLSSNYPNTKEVAAKDFATLEVSIKLAAAGVNYLRVHNVALHKAKLMHPITT